MISMEYDLSHSRADYVHNACKLFFGVDWLLVRTLDEIKIPLTSEILEFIKLNKCSINVSWINMDFRFSGKQYYCMIKIKIFFKDTNTMMLYKLRFG